MLEEEFATLHDPILERPLFDRRGSKFAILSLAPPSAYGQGEGFFCCYQVRYPRGPVRMLDRASSAAMALRGALDNLATETFLRGESDEASDPWHGFPPVSGVPEAARRLDEGDFDGAFPLLNRLARDGNAWARARLGFGLFLGVEFHIDQPKGLEWLTLAAEQGDPGSCDFLASTYRMRADHQDEAKAAYYAERALLCGINVFAPACA